MNAGSTGSEARPRGRYSEVMNYLPSEKAVSVVGAVPSGLDPLPVLVAAVVGPNLRGVAFVVGRIGFDQASIELLEVSPSEARRI